MRSSATTDEDSYWIDRTVAIGRVSATDQFIEKAKSIDSFDLAFDVFVFFLVVFAFFPLKFIFHFSDLHLSTFPHKFIFII